MMRPDVLCTAVEYDIPAVWVIWNNFAYGGIRDIQLGMFAKREIATSFVREKDGRSINPRLRGAGARVRGGRDPRRAPRRSGRSASSTPSRPTAPFVLDVHVDRDIRPPGVGTWPRSTSIPARATSRAATPRSTSTRSPRTSTTSCRARGSWSWTASSSLGRGQHMVESTSRPACATGSSNTGWRTRSSSSPRRPDDHVRRWRRPPADMPAVRRPGTRRQAPSA